MMFPELQGIKIKRQKLGLKQKELSQLAKISQSLIAKIESGNLIPSYEIARRIFQTLESLEHKNEKKCSQIMVPVITIDKKENVGKAIEIMKKNSISQLPVLNGKEAVGSISESTVYNKILNGTQKNILMKEKIESVMEESFPVIKSDYPISAAMPLLKSSEAILLTEKHNIVGIITKSSLL